MNKKIITKFLVSFGVLMSISVVAHSYFLIAKADDSVIDASSDD